MKKTITIDGKEIQFSSNAYFANIFKNQFGYDILTVLLPFISELLKSADNLYTSSQGGEIKPSSIGELLENVYSLEAVDVNNIIWAMAKTADPTIDEPQKWFTQFEEFPYIDILSELWDMMLPSLISKKKLEEIKARLKIPTSQSTPKQ